MNEKKWMIVSDVMMIAGMIYMSIAISFIFSKVIFGLCAAVFTLDLFVNYSKESVQSIRTSKRYIFLIVIGIIGTMFGTSYEKRQAERDEMNRVLSDEEILAIYEESYPEHDEITGIYNLYLNGASYEVLTSGENQWSITFLDQTSIVGSYEGEGTINLYNGIIDNQYYYNDSDILGIYMINRIDQEIYKYVISEETISTRVGFDFKYHFEQYDLGNIDSMESSDFQTNLFYTNFSKKYNVLDIYTPEESSAVQTIVLYRDHDDSNGCIACFRNFDVTEWFDDSDMIICDETSLILTDDQIVECIFEKTDGTKQKLVIDLDGSFIQWQDVEEL